MTQTPVTLERIENAIAVTIDQMEEQPDLSHQLLPVLQRLEVERDRLLAIGDPIQYAKRLRARIKVA
jgi:hypothetical protein